MFDQFVFAACFVTVCTLAASWAYAGVESAEAERFGVTTVEHVR